MPRLSRALRIIAGGILLFLTFGTGWIVAKAGIGSAMDASTLPERERLFAEKMRNISMVGRFTIDGREDRPARPDSYDIYTVEKVGPDRWRFNARIGEHNLTLPVVVTMRWVDDTPVIMLTDLTIPTLGTFSARVFFYGNRYAGTWQHGSVGGHMFGNIVPSKDTQR